MNEPTMKQYADGSKAWYLHGKLHRVDAPAIEWADGDKMWYQHGALHREHGPAIESKTYKAWCLHSMRHRDDGPAIEYINGAMEWWLNNKRYEDVESWAEASLQMQNKSCDAADVDAFLKQILKKQVQNAL